MFRPQKISATEARRKFTKLLSQVQHGSKSFVIQNYHYPAARIVNEVYIRALEEVLGGQTVNKILQIIKNDFLLEGEKLEKVKKVFRERFPKESEPKPPQPKRVTEPHSVNSRKQQENNQKKPKRKGSAERGSAQHHNHNNEKPLLLQDGKNYK